MPVGLVRIEAAELSRSCRTAAPDSEGQQLAAESGRVPVQNLVDAVDRVHDASPGGRADLEKLEPVLIESVELSIVDPVLRAIVYMSQACICGCFLFRRIQERRYDHEVGGVSCCVP